MLRPKPKPKRYRAECDGYIGSRRIARDTVFDFDGPKGLWMTEVDPKTPLYEPPADATTPRWVGVSEREEARVREHMRRAYESARDYPTFDRTTYADLKK